MQLTSPDFTEGSRIPKRFTCEGENVSPELHVSGVPERTTCLALVMDDPDAPAGTFTHWIVWNIPFTVSKFSSTNMPKTAVEGENSAGKMGYVGPCPPTGTHRYFFRLYALDTSVVMEEELSLENLNKAMMGHIVAQAELVGLYAKEQG
jgi:Raf kinase inhibitor-like YbhB/YbcL family protein